MTPLFEARSAMTFAPLLGLILALAAQPAAAQSEIDPAKPKKHFTVTQPAGLTGTDAQGIYDRIKDDMVSGYRLSLEPYASSYAGWTRYNTAPYRSAQHGERFVNNYANNMARAYRLYERSGPMPAGAVLVKDSFAVTKKGGVFSGPLFVMEKMAPGFEVSSGDWRYTTIMPDGSRLGTTNGSGSERVEFCASCHARVGAEQDHMFYVPEAYRVGAAD
jgi:cytochrome P460